MERLKAMLLAACALVGFVVPLTMSSEAWAICTEPRTIYEVTGKRTTWRRTNISGPWMGPGMSATYTTSDTTKLGATIMHTAGADASVIVATASASTAVTLGMDYAWSKTWSINSGAVPRGKDGRMVLLHEGRVFTWVKKVLVSPCRYVVVRRIDKADLPLRGHHNKWWLELRPTTGGPTGAPAEDGGEPVGVGEGEEVEGLEGIDLGPAEGFEEVEGEGTDGIDPEAFEADGPISRLEAPVVQIFFAAFAPLEQLWYEVSRAAS